MIRESAVRIGLGICGTPQHCGPSESVPDVLWRLSSLVVIRNKTKQKQGALPLRFLFFFKKKFLLGFGEGGGRFHGTWDLRSQEILSSLRTLTYETE